MTQLSVDSKEKQENDNDYQRRAINTADTNGDLQDPRSRCRLRLAAATMDQSTAGSASRNRQLRTQQGPR